MFYEYEIVYLIKVAEKQLLYEKRSMKNEHWREIFSWLCSKQFFILKKFFYAEPPNSKSIFNRKVFIQGNLTITVLH